MSGHLSIISIPIGNMEDITLRALRVLKEIDILICEEYKYGKQMLRLAEVDKPLIRLNEHTVKEATKEILDLLISDKSMGLISDCGTPVFSDPGLELIKKCYKNKIQVTTVPGASSLMPALVLSGFNLDSFKFYGWLSREKSEREKKLEQLNRERQTVVIMETPYRFNHMIESLNKVLKPDRFVALCCDLTTANEEIFRGPISELFQIFKDQKIKREFIVVVSGMNETP